MVGGRPDRPAWVEANREAMELFRRGSERPNALAPSGPLHRGSDRLFAALNSFQEMALLEASRLEVEGEMAAAWGWYARPCGRPLTSACGGR